MWQGIMKVLEFHHFDKNKKLLSSQYNMHNMLHLKGEEYVLKTVFSGLAIPTNYYLGLDNRAEILEGDTINSLLNEPSTSGYSRQAILGNSMNVALDNGHYQALTAVIYFEATGGTWGSVKNLFLATASGNTGILISTTALETAVTVRDGESTSMRLGMKLRDC